MKVKTGRERYRCISVSLGGYGRSLSSDHVILELEEQDEATGDLTWRYATYEDLRPTNDT